MRVGEHPRDKDILLLYVYTFIQSLSTSVFHQKRENTLGQPNWEVLILGLGV